jgi:1,2-diacylglycerol-3-alpha-glucose alpha-1,2-glucosyltransferase
MKNQDDVLLHELEQLKQVYFQIDSLEKKYPYMVTTIIAIAGIFVSLGNSNFQITNIPITKSLDLNTTLCLVFPVVTVMLLSYILNSFKQVALLRGYAAYIEERINNYTKQTLSLWNLKYIDKFIENDQTNVLLLIASSITAIFTSVLYITILFETNLSLEMKVAVSTSFIIALALIAYFFKQNDKYRRHSYWKAKNEQAKIVRVCLFPEFENIVRKSGVGKAKELQKKALEINNIYFTRNSGDYYNVLHLNTLGFRSLFLAKKCKQNKIKVVVTAHTIIEDFIHSFLLTCNPLTIFIVKKWICRFYNLADVVIAPTQYVKDRLQSKDYQVYSPIYVVSNGVDTGVFRDSNSSRIDDKREIINYINKIKKKHQDQIEENDRVVMSVGMYIERKGILDFIDLAKKNPEIKFVWYGKTSYGIIPSKIVIALKEAYEIPNLFFPGYIEHHLLRKAYKASSYFISLSSAETESLVILEALASGIPVICLDIDAYKGWLEDQVNCIIWNKSNESFESLVKRTEENKESIIIAGINTAMERALNITGLKLNSVYCEITK